MSIPIADQDWDKNQVKYYIHEQAKVPVRLADRGAESWTQMDLLIEKSG